MDDARAATATAERAAPQGAALPLEPGSQGATVRMRPLRCGEASIPPGWIFRHPGPGATRRALGLGLPRTQWVRGPMGAFLLEHPSAGPVLVDTGIHSQAAARLRDNFGRVNAFFFRTLEMSPQQSVAAQLRELGIEPGEVGLVVMTHLHVDHTSAMAEFPAATFLCGAAEWGAATARFGEWSGYVSSQLPPASRVRTIDFNVPQSSEHQPFGRTLDLFGDGAIRLLDTPGHSKGHISVLVRVEGGEALLVGDAAYTLRSVREQILPWRTIDDATYRRTLGQLQAYTEQNPQAVVIPTHDEDVWDSLRAVY